jgi:hypothetical protein
VFVVGLETGCESTALDIPHVCGRRVERCEEIQHGFEGCGIAFVSRGMDNH